MGLVLEQVTKSFGGLRAVGGVSFTVGDKVIFGLIGPNGAGKTTVFNLVTGVYKPDSGAIAFGGVDLVALKPAQIAGAGVARTFQNIRLFGQLTVVENLLVACELQKKAHLASAVLRLPAHYEDERAMHERATELLRIFDLHEMADEAPTSLPYGDQRRLEIARAMMLGPSILLLDEPAAGMNYGEAEGLKTQIRWLRDTFGVAIVLVEHNMQVVMGVCEELHVLDHGETIAHGTPDEIRKHPKVLAAYLGEDEEAPSVRAAVEEASNPALPDVAPSPRAAGEADAATAPPRAEKLSEPELADLSRELTRSLERGLAAPDADDEGLAEPGAKEPAAVEAVEVVTAPPAPPARVDPEIAPSAPDVSALDGGWGSEPEAPARDAHANGVDKGSNGVGPHGDDDPHKKEGG
ncbi:MAG: ATP-binding cassette domain-containing protein [Labilithrix sp.]|nr:ATP-binding cassette domain-containing protein [Labilithrix sp.]